MAGAAVVGNSATTRVKFAVMEYSQAACSVTKAGGFGEMPLPSLNHLLVELLVYSANAGRMKPLISVPNVLPTFLHWYKCFTLLKL
eukprot:7408762-Pyramimonas_sp.AAC.1